MNEESDAPASGPARVPYIGIIAAVTAAILLGFAWVTWQVISDPSSSRETVGSLIQTWNNLAVAVGAFWLGSSVGGKLQGRKQ